MTELTWSLHLSRDIKQLWLIADSHLIWKLQCLLPAYSLSKYCGPLSSPITMQVYMLGILQVRHLHSILPYIAGE